METNTKGRRKKKTNKKSRHPISSVTWHSFKLTKNYLLGVLDIESIFERNFLDYFQKLLLFY